MPTNNSRKTSPLEWLAVGAGALVLLRVFGRDENDPVPPPPPDVNLDGSVATYPRQFYIDTADAIDVELFQYFIEDESEVRRLIGKMQTTNDILQLVNFYGTRFHVWPLGSWTLAAALQYFLDPDQLHELNLSLARKGIQYRF